MRKLLLASAALVVFAAPASADVDINLSGTIAESCSIGAAGASEVSTFPINLTNTTAFQETETLQVVCNFGGQASVTLTSNNSGELTNQFGDFVTYNVSTPTGSRTGSSIASPVTYAVATGSTHVVYVKVNEAATRAGTYTDTIVATVSP